MSTSTMKTLALAAGLSIIMFAGDAAAAKTLQVAERERAGSDGPRHRAKIHAFVSRRLLQLQAADERGARGLVGLCDDFGSEFMDDASECDCDDSAGPDDVRIECRFADECAYGGSVCSNGGTLAVTARGFAELADLMEVETSQRQTSHDLEIAMTSCTEYISPAVGTLCFSLPLTATVYLTTEDLRQVLKTGESCEITLEGKDCVCEMDKEDEYVGDGEEPCFTTDCSAVDDSVSVNSCKLVVKGGGATGGKEELQTSFLLPFRQIEKKDETEEKKAEEATAAEVPVPAPAISVPEEVPATAASSPADDSDETVAGRGNNASSVIAADIWCALALLGAIALEII